MTTTRSRTATPASPASINFMTTLLAQRLANANDAPLFEHIARMQAAGTTPAQRLVSQAIDSLKASPWKPRPQVAQDAPLPPMVTTEEVDLSGVAEGRYGIPGSPSRLKVRIQKPTEGRWAGWTFVADAAEYGYGRKYGAAKPGQNYRGDILDALRTIAADPRAAIAEYGHLTGRCTRCNRKLEDVTSVLLGIGPDCRTKGGW